MQGLLSCLATAVKAYGEREKTMATSVFVIAVRAYRGAGQKGYSRATLLL